MTNEERYRTLKHGQCPVCQGTSLDEVDMNEVTYVACRHCHAGFRVWDDMQMAEPA